MSHNINSFFSCCSNKQKNLHGVIYHVEFCKSTKFYIKNVLQGLNNFGTLNCMPGDKHFPSLHSFLCLCNRFYDNYRYLLNSTWYLNGMVSFMFVSGWKKSEKSGVGEKVLPLLLKALFTFCLNWYMTLEGIVLDTNWLQTVKSCGTWYFVNVFNFGCNIDGDIGAFRNCEISGWQKH